MVHIVIADTHKLCREALGNYIRNADQSLTVSTTGDYRELCDLIARQRADLVIIEDAMIKNEFSFDCMNGAKLGIMFGAAGETETGDWETQGVFSKGSSCKSFFFGIQKILSGQTYNAEEDIESAPMPMQWTKTPHDFSLTLREKEVLSHLVRGESNKNIARALQLQVVTIKLHVRGICRKMKVSNRTQAALLAKENGWA